MPRTTPSLLLALCLGLGIALAPTTALARPSVLQAGHGIGITMGADLDVLGIAHFPDIGFDVRLGLLTSDTIFSAGLGGTGYNLPALPIGLVLGNIVIGLRFEAGLIHVNPDGPFSNDINVGVFSPVAFFEYWLDGEDMAPFFGAQFGPAITIPDGGDTNVFLTAGGLGGLHFFVTDSFSVGPTAQINFLYDSGSQRAGWELVLGFSMRGWIDPSGGGSSGGGGGGAGPAPVEDTWQPPPPSNDPPPPADPEAGAY